MLFTVFAYLCAISGSLAQSFDSEPLDWVDRHENGAYQFGYATGDEGKHYHVASATANNMVSGRFGYKDPVTGGDLQTVYTAGRKGFRARGPHIARRMDLSQNRPPFARPNNDGKYIPELDNVFDPNEDRGYDFSYRTPTHTKEEHADRAGDVQGRYSYVDDVGNRHTVEYIAGSGTGFVVTNPVPDTFARARGGPLYFVGKRPGPKIRGFHAIQKALDGSYRFEASGPDHKRSEVSDAIGNRRGTYTYLDDKGIQHTVEYIAGPNIGYKVINNKKGTIYNPVLPFFPDTPTIGPFSPSFPSTTFRPTPSFGSASGGATTFRPIGGTGSSSSSGGSSFRPGGSSGFGGSTSDFGSSGSGSGGGSSFGGSGSGGAPSFGGSGSGGGSSFSGKPTEPTKFPIGETGSTLRPSSSGGGLSPTSPTPSSSPDSHGQSPPSSSLDGGSPTSDKNSASPTKPTNLFTPSKPGNFGESDKWNYNSNEGSSKPPHTPSKDWSKPDSDKKPRPGIPANFPFFTPSFFGEGEGADDNDARPHECFVNGTASQGGSNHSPPKKPFRGSIKFGGIRRSENEKEKREEYFEIPSGVALRAHVQSLDIVPLNKRFASPSEALEALDKKKHS